MGRNCIRDAKDRLDRWHRQAAAPQDVERINRERQERFDKVHSLPLVGRYCLGYGWVADLSAPNQDTVAIKMLRIEAWRDNPEPTLIGARPQLPIDRRQVGEVVRVRLLEGRWGADAIEFRDGVDVIEIHVGTPDQRWHLRSSAPDGCLFIGGADDCLIEYPAGESSRLRLRDRRLRASGELIAVSLGVACEPNVEEASGLSAAAESEGGVVTPR